MAAASVSRTASAGPGLAAGRRAKRGLIHPPTPARPYAGGRRVAARSGRGGARDVVVVYNGLDPHTHHAVAPDPRFAADCALLANRLPHRAARLAASFFRA